MNKFIDVISPQGEHGTIPIEKAEEAKSAGFTIVEQPQIKPESSDNTLQTARDFLRGTAQGVTLGGADELVGAYEAAKAYLEGQPDWQDAYRKHQKESEQAFTEAEERSPIAYNIGEIGSGIATGLATGGVGLGTKATQVGARQIAKQIAKEAAKGAAVGVTAGALGSTGDTGEGKEQLVSDITSGGILGGAFGGGLQAAKDVNKALGVTEGIKDLIKDSPILRQSQLAFERGLKGQEISGGEKATDILSREKQHYATKFVDDILGIDKKLGQNLDKVLVDADNANIIIPKSQNLDTALATMIRTNTQGIQTLDPQTKMRLVNNKIDPIKFMQAAQNPELPTNAAFIRRSFERLADTYEPVSPEYQYLKYLSNDLYNELKDKVVDPTSGKKTFEVANTMFNKYRELGPETIIHEGTPIGYRTDRWLGDSSNFPNTVYESSIEMLQNMNRGGSSAEVAKTTANQYIKNMKAFDTSFKNELQNIGIDLDIPQRAKDLQEKGDIFALGKRIVSIDPMSAPTAKAFAAAKDTTTSRGLVIGASNVLGRGAKQISTHPASPIKWGNKLYNLGEDQILKLTGQLQTNPNLANQAQALQQAIANKDPNRKNAVLFILSQNPTARGLINDMIGDDEE